MAVGCSSALNAFLTEVRRRECCGGEGGRALGSSDGVAGDQSRWRGRVGRGRQVLSGQSPERARQKRGDVKSAEGSQRASIGSCVRPPQLPVGIFLGLNTQLASRHARQQMRLAENFAQRFLWGEKRAGSAPSRMGAPLLLGSHQQTRRADFL